MSKRHFIFTIYSNETHFVTEDTDDVLKLEGSINYLAYQLERCPTTERLHLQGYIQLNNKSRYSAIQKLGGYWQTAHFKEVGVDNGASTYGMKEDTRINGPWQHGEKRENHPAKTSKMKEMIEIIKEGGSIVTCFEKDMEFVSVNKRKVENAIELYRMLKRSKEEIDVPELKSLPNTWGLEMPVENKKKRHYWIWSTAPSRGKTAFTNFLKKTGFAQEIELVDKCSEMDDRRKILVIDEYNNAKLTISEINKICDGTKTFDVKYGKPISIRDALVIVTSNGSISDLYPNKAVLLQARFNEINVD